MNDDDINGGLDSAAEEIEGEGVGRMRGDKTLVAIELASINYRAVRQNILEFVRMRDRYIVFTYIGIGIIFSFSIANTGMIIALLAIPIAQLVSALLYVQTDLTIGVMALWIKDEYCPFVDGLTGHEIPNWDKSNLGAIFFSRRLFARRNFGLSLLFLASGSIAYIARLLNDKAFLDPLLAVIKMQVTQLQLIDTLTIAQHMIHIACTIVSAVLLHMSTAQRKDIHGA